MTDRAPFPTNPNAGLITSGLARSTGRSRPRWWAAAPDTGRIIHMRRLTSVNAVPYRRLRKEASLGRRWPQGYHLYVDVQGTLTLGGPVDSAQGWLCFFFRVPGPVALTSCGEVA